MAREQSVAPKERINVTFKPATGDAQEQVELPLRLLMLGDYTLREDLGPLADREPVSVTKDTFNSVMAAQDLGVNIQVKNKISDSDEELPVKLSFENLKDFNPERIVEQVDPLKELLELRNALKTLKGPLGSKPEFRRKLEALIADEDQLKNVLGELGINTESDSA